MNMPCIVTLDLHRHLRQMDWQDARDERAQEFRRSAAVICWRIARD